MRQKLADFTLLFFVFCLFLAPESPNASAGTVDGPKNIQPEIAPPEISDDYVIGVEDVISIYVWKEPDFSIKDLVVRSDGKISLPLASDILAGGLTPKQLERSITGMLKEYVASPKVTVSVLKSMSRMVSVVGQVNRPGAYPMIGSITVIEMFARAGGITEFAKAKDIKIIRNQKGKTKQFLFNYKDAIRGRNLQQNIMLEPGDVILVP